MNQDPHVPLALQDKAGKRSVPMAGTGQVPQSSPRVMAWLFVLFIAGVPLLQIGLELARGESVTALDVFGPVDEHRLREFEQELRETSFLHRDVLPWYQAALTAVLQKGNEKAIEGKDGWLFYREDLLNTAGPSVMDEGVGGREAVAAIVDFRDQLAARGIQLLVVPSVSKEMVDAESFSRFAAGKTALENQGLETFYRALSDAGIETERMDRWMAQLREESGDPHEPLTLTRDTHWRPATMQRIARKLAARVETMIGAAAPSPARYRTRPVEMEGVGDLAQMLRLPEAWPVFPTMAIELEQVVDANSGALFAADENAEVLLMGDSLTKVFGDPSLGLGESAGLGEHLALELNRPLDVIALAGGSATATRDALARRARGPDGKKLVIWQFGVRMLAMGAERWRKVEMPPPVLEANSGSGVTAQNGNGPWTVVGEMTAVSRIPEEFDYEFCLAVYAYRITALPGGPSAKGAVGDTIWVAHVAMEKFKDTEGARFEVGLRHRLALDPIEEHFDLEKVSWIDDTDAGFDIWFPVEWSVAEK